MNIAAKAALRARYSEMANDGERSYAAELDRRLAAGEILWWKYAGQKLILAPRTSITIDFFVVAKDYVMEAHEFKGFWRDDAKAKTKIAAEQWPYRFKIVTERRVKAGGGFNIEDVPGLAYGK